MTALLRGHSLGRPMEFLRGLLVERSPLPIEIEPVVVVSFEDLYHQQLQDMHSCERQLSRVWVRLTGVATHPQLKGMLAALVVETKKHLGRLHVILGDLDSGPHRTVCGVTRAIVDEGCAGLTEAPPGAVCDARILCAGQKFQHHQIATYGALSMLSELLMRRSDRSLLDATLQEEGGTQGRFASLASAYVAVLTYPPVPTNAGGNQQEVLAHA